MWKFISAGTTGGPLLRSLNGNKGRQTWEYDPAAGTPEQRAEAERLREEFTANKDKHHHSGDELLRLQSADRIRAKKHSPPSGPVPDAPDAERVEEHLKGAISFYECLQQEDGHFPGDYGGPMFLLPGLVITLYTCGALDQVRVWRGESRAEGGTGRGAWLRAVRVCACGGRGVRALQGGATHGHETQQGLVKGPRSACHRPGRGVCGNGAGEEVRGSGGGQRHRTWGLGLRGMRHAGHGMQDRACRVSRVVSGQAVGWACRGG